MAEVKNNGLTITFVLDKESYSKCKKKIDKLNEELKNAQSTIEEIDKAIKELKILTKRSNQDNEERNK